MNIFLVALIGVMVAQPVLASPSHVAPAPLPLPLLPFQPVRMPLEAQWMMIEMAEDSQRADQANRLFRYLLQLFVRHQCQLTYLDCVRLGDLMNRFRAWRRQEVAESPRVGAFEIVPAFWTRQEQQVAEILRRQRSTENRVEELTE